MNPTMQSTGSSHPIVSGLIYKGLEFRQRIGDESGMGDVWLAYQPAVQREVAVKVIKPERANDPDFIRRFEREAQLVAKLEHPSIVPLYDFWREPNGAFLVIRLLRGGSLQEQYNSGAKSPEKLFTWLEQLGSALTLAHSEGVIHRDIKPANILLDQYDVSYLVDFGIARSVQSTSDTESSGTMGYAAPEQFMGQPTDGRTDLFSLGVVLYELLTGERGFAGLDGIAKLLNTPLPPIQESVADLPNTLNDVIQKVTAKNPDDRYATAIELVEAFRSAIGLDTAAISQEDDYEITLDVVNPYKGLKAFQESDQAYFFGRESFTDQLLARLRESDSMARFLAVLGPSGSGKSSIVKAGLIPKIRGNALDGSDRWFIVEMMPSTKPFEELEAKLLQVAVNPPDSLAEQLRGENGISRAIKRTLPDDNSELLLVIDQFEELFTLTDESDRDAFMGALLAALNDSGSRLRVVITLRADFYDRPLNYLEFGELLRQRIAVVLPMSENEVRAAIINPAKQVGARFEAGLVERILAEVGEEPGILPLLQYALTELFDKRTGRMLTIEAYDELGGIVGALGKRADTEFEQSSSERREAARQIFLRLITLGEGTEDTRRRVRVSELGDSATVSDVVGAYSNARLLTTDHDPETRAPTIEVAHEALIQTWGRLRDWLNNSREELYIQRRLTQETTEWLNNNRDAGLLASGTRLTQFMGFSEATTLLINPDERAYLDASIAQRQAIEAAELERKTQEEKVARRVQNLQRASLALGAVIILALIGGLYGSQVALDNIEEQRNIASTQAAIAKQQADVAQSLALSSQAQLINEENQPLGIALGLYAVQVDNPPTEAQQALNEIGLSSGPIQVIRIEDFDAGIGTVMYSPDGQTLLSGQYDGTISLWQVETGEEIWRVQAHDSSEELISAVFSPEGDRIISAGDDAQVLIWDARTGEQIGAMDLPDEVIVTSIAYTPDSNQVIAGTDAAVVLVFDANSGELLNSLEGHEDFINSVAVSPDGTQALSGSDDNLVILWDLETGEAIYQMAGHEDWVQSVAFSPDGETALSGSDDASVILWDLETGTLLRTFNEHASFVYEVAFSPDGRFALSASDDTFVILWDLSSGVSLKRFAGHIQGVNSTQFSPDGRQAVSASYDNSIVIWDLQGAFVWQRYLRHESWVQGISFSPDGQQFLSASYDERIILWDLQTGEPIKEFLWEDAPLESVAFAPDGQAFIAASTGLVSLWDIESGEIIRIMEEHDETEWMRVTYLPDSEHGVSAGDDGRIIYWDLGTGDAVKMYEIEDAGVRSISVSPDEQYLVASTDGGQVLVWELFADEPAYIFEAEVGFPIAAFSPDMRLMAAGTTDGEVIIWDVASGDVVQQLFGHSDFVFGLTFDNDGERIFSSSTDGDVIIWNVADGMLLHRLREHTDVVFDIEISPDGQTALTASDDRSIIAWDIGKDLDTVDQQVEWICANRAVAELSDVDINRFRLEDAAPVCGIGQ